MPRNLNDYAYISVPVRKGSHLHLHLKEEALRAGGSISGQIGPYVASLLEDRDRHLYGEEGQALWFPSQPGNLTRLMEQAIQKALASTLPPLLMFRTEQPQPRSQTIEPSSEEAMDLEAQALAASLRSGGWSCEIEE